MTYQEHECSGVPDMLHERAVPVHCGGICLVWTSLNSSKWAMLIGLQMADGAGSLLL